MIPDGELQPPTFLLTMATAAARHGLSAMAGVAIAHGALAKSQEMQFESVGMAVVLFVISYGWSFGAHWLQRLNADTRVAEAKQ